METTTLRQLRSTGQVLLSNNSHCKRHDSVDILYDVISCNVLNQPIKNSTIDDAQICLA